MKRYCLILAFLLIIVNTNSQSVKRTVFDDVDFVVEPIRTINTVASDISPFFVGDQLFFSSVREQYFNKDRRANKNKAFYDVYKADLNADGILVSSRTLVPGFGADYHEGPAAYCKATGELFVTLSNVTHPDTLRKMFPVEDVRLRLAIMTKVDGVWKVKEELPFNDDRFHFAHPAINPTGDTLVFSSDIDSLTIGKADLFMSVRKDGSWSDPINLGHSVNTPGNEMYPAFIDGSLLSFASDGRSEGYGGLDIYYTTFPNIGSVINLGDKINTHLDEFGLVIHPNKKVGYFASNRGNVGSDDIFRLDIRRLYYAFSGRVVDDEKSTPIPKASVNLYGCRGDIVGTAISDNSGNFEFEVLNSDCPVVEASKSGYSNTKKEIAGLTLVELRLKQKQRWEILVLDIENKKPLTGAIISGGNTFSASTDNTGLVALQPPFSYDYNLLVEKEGYLKQTFMPDAAKLVSGFARDTILLYKKEINKTFVLDYIYYDFDKWDILPESEVELNKLIRIMNDNQNLKVELGSHTDARGNDAYNMLLSQKRSDSAVAYIVQSGIPKERIVAKGYGETQLINQCKNGVKCSDEEHRKNRRTEFKIIAY